ncbi:MAG: ATP-binding protein [Campylobacterota bacterium]
MGSHWETVHFLSHVNIKNIIGKELINDDNVAVMELVKNSYDAGAKEVTVEFRHLKADRKDHEILIVDNGKGMSKDDILYKWLNLAYSIKRVQNTQNNRLQAGNKGIGRFSCDRLGKKLDIYTKQQSKAYQLRINWEDFENITDYSIEINQIPMQLRKLTDAEIKNETGYEIGEQGTIVKISDLREEWIKFNENSLLHEVLNQQKFVSLKSTLEKLINKSQVETDDFKILLKVNEIDDDAEPNYNKRINGEIKNKFFEKLDFNTTYIHSAISEDGQYIITKLKDRDKIIFKTIEKNTEFPELKNIKIILMHLNPYGKVYFKKQMGVRSVDFGSVYLFINGFRIPPYGDSDNDSFGLEGRKGQGQRRYLGGRDIVGRIEIEDRNEQYAIISSREGIVQNEAYNQLIHKSTRSTKSQIKNNGFFYKTLKRLEKYVVEGLSWDSVPKGLTETKIEEMISYKKWDDSQEVYVLSREKKLSNISQNIFSLMGIDSKNIVDLYINTDILSYLVDDDPFVTKHNIASFLKDFSQIPHYAIDQQLNTFVETIIKSIDDDKLLKKFEFIANKNFTDIEEVFDKEQFYQQLDKKIKILEDTESKLKKELETVKIQKKKIEEQVSYLKSVQSKDVSELIAFQHHIGLYTKTAKDCILDIIDIMKKEEKHNQKVFEYLKDASFELDKISLINKYITREDFLSTTTTVDKDLVKFISDYVRDIYEITTNKELVITINTNDSKFNCNFEPIKINIIIDNLLNNSKKAKANQVNMSFKSENQYLELEYIDDGKGLDKNIVEVDSIFEMGITTTKGSGLGLYHVKEILKEMNNSVINVYQQNSGIKFIIRFKL